MGITGLCLIDGEKIRREDILNLLGADFVAETDEIDGLLVKFKVSELNEGAIFRLIDFSKDVGYKIIRFNITTENKMYLIKENRLYEFELDNGLLVGDKQEVLRLDFDLDIDI